MPQLRQHPLTGDWVVIAPERARRPSDYRSDRNLRHGVHEQCLFCSSGPVYREQLVEFERKDVYVVHNKYPAFVNEQTKISTRNHSPESNLFHEQPALGGHDVVIVKNGANHLADFSSALWQDLLETIRDRMLTLGELSHVQSIVPFYNHGSAAGASLDHPHAQLIAAPMIPTQIGQELRTMESYYDHHQRCLMCDLVRDEQAAAHRCIRETAHFIACTAYAARFPFEAIVMPKTHMDRFELTDPVVLRELTSVLQDLFHRYDRLLNDPPLNFYVHTLPAALDRSDAYHWHIEVTPRMNTYGGFELAGGVVIDIVSPEHAAAYLRGERTD